MTNPLNRFSSSNNWVVPITAMCLVLGFMISMANVTGNSKAKESRLRASQDPDLQARVAMGNLDLQVKFRELQQEVNKIRAEKTDLENAVADQTKGTQTLNNQLQDAKFVAALTDVEGPGVMVTLKDSKPEVPDATDSPLSLPPVELSENIIHDQDVLRVVNELWASGAEAISINNIRLGPNSSVRCVGPVVNVNGAKVASPIKIRAIGDQETLYGALTMPGGIVGELQGVDPEMVELEKIEKMSLPAFAGPTTRRYAVVPPPKK